tara:strand:- start:2718 stop:3167 length:450 start_codon:yes stop_codon:yes gene_type:complete
MFFIITAVLTVFGLAAYAGYLHFLLRKKERRQSAAQLELQEQAKEKREQVNSSIQILAKSCGVDQLTFTEASIRIRGLLNTLSVDESIREEFSAFYQLADATAHIPVLAEWKKLTRSEQNNLQREREKLEQQHREFVQSAAKRILGRSF